LLDLKIHSLELFGRLCGLEGWRLLLFSVSLLLLVRLLFVRDSAFGMSFGDHMGTYGSAFPAVAVAAVHHPIQIEHFLSSLEPRPFLTHP